MKVRKLFALLLAAAMLFSFFSFEISAEEGNSVYEYYYTLLSHDEKLAYDVIRENILTGADNDDPLPVNGYTETATSFSLVGMNFSAEVQTGAFQNYSQFKAVSNAVYAPARKAVNAFVLDHPEYFWANGGIQFGYGTSSGPIYTDGSGIITDGEILLTPPLRLRSPVHPI